MGLRILLASDPVHVETIVTCISGGPGLGKTTLAFSSEKPLLFDFDRGVHRAANRGDAVPIGDWSEVTDPSPTDFKGYKTLVIDTAGRALDMLSIDIIRQDAKNGRGGALTLQGYGVLKSRFTSWLKMIRSFGLDVVLICHSSEERRGDDLIERLDMQGSSKNEVYKVADLMGNLGLVKGERTLNFNPGDVAFGKNPGQLPVYKLPDVGAMPGFLAKIIADTKSALNKLSAEQKDVTDALATWNEKLGGAASAEDFDRIFEEMKTAPANLHANLKRMLDKAAKAEGLAFSREAGKFVAAPKAAARGGARRSA